MFAVAAPCGCTPVPVPSWFVDIPTALAVSQEVVHQGPYGERQALTSPRSAHEALPRDTIRLTPLIVDEAGLVPPERVDVAWFLCETADCVLSLAVEAPAACPPTPAYDTVTFCELGRGSSVEFELGEPEVGDAIVLADLLTAPSVLLVGSATPAVPVATCFERLSRRAALDECFLVSRRVHLGPAFALVEAARDAGIELPSDSGQGFLFGLERNHNPLVERFTVEVDGRSLEVPHGSVVEARRGRPFGVRWTPDARDVESQTLLDPFDPEAETSVVIETVRGRWYASARDVELDGTLDNGLVANLDLPSNVSAFHLFFVVSDDRGSEAWGWLVIAPID